MLKLARPTLGFALAAIPLLRAGSVNAQECSQLVLDESSLAGVAKKLASKDVDTGVGAAIATAAGSDSEDAKCLRQYALVAVNRWLDAHEWNSCAGALKKWSLPKIGPMPGWRALTVVVGGDVTRLSFDIASDDAVRNLVVYSAPASFHETTLQISVPPSTKQINYRLDCSTEDRLYELPSQGPVRLAKSYAPSDALRGDTILVNGRPVVEWPISLWGAAPGKYVASLEGKPKCQRQLLRPGPFEFDKGCGDEDEPRSGVSVRLGPDFALGEVSVLSNLSVVASGVWRPATSKYVAPFGELGLLSTGERYGWLLGLGWALAVFENVDVVPLIDGEYVKIAVPTTTSRFVVALQPRVLVRPHWNHFGFYGSIGYTAVLSDVSADLVQKGYVSAGAGVEMRWE